MTPRLLLAALLVSAAGCDAVSPPPPELARDAGREAGWCLDCAAAIQPLANLGDVCAGSSQARLVAWIECTCAGRVPACGSYCVGNASLAAGGCFDATMVAGCAEAYTACVEDDGATP